MISVLELTYLNRTDQTILHTLYTDNVLVGMDLYEVDEELSSKAVTVSTSINVSDQFEKIVIKGERKAVLMEALKTFRPPKGECVEKFDAEEDKEKILKIISDEYPELII